MGRCLVAVDPVGLAEAGELANNDALRPLAATNVTRQESLG